MPHARVTIKSVRANGLAANLRQNLILRKIQKNIKTIYSVRQTDRNIIVKQMKTLLSENLEMWVVRLDVRHFYESINRNYILKIGRAHV